MTPERLKEIRAWINRQMHDEYYPPSAATLELLAEVDRLTRELDETRRRLLTAAGDDLCRLSQEEIWTYTSGTVKIPPKDEFLASCERFHAQVAKESGVMENCLTLAQLIAENERLKELYETACNELSTAERERDEATQFARFVLRQYVPPDIAEAIRDNKPWLKETT